MGIIKQLDQQVANQIAAGEVVERPSSVIKELLENALDAQAQNIEIRIKNGGLDYLVVADDGLGMDQADAKLAIQRYATSKLIHAADLQKINSYGFRGEALPSIASISRLNIITRQEQDTHGTKLEIAGGKIISCGSMGYNIGTRIEVRDLFYNVPARKKFVKSYRSESSHIDKLIRLFVFANNKINFKFFRDDKLIFDVNSQDILSRAQVLLGEETKNYLFEFNSQTELVKLEGVICAPMVCRRDRRSMHVFVNKRIIESPKILGAIKAAYRTLLEVGNFPLLALKINIDPDLVDINIHPRKTDVRFRDESRVFSHVIKLLGDFLATTPWLNSQQEYLINNNLENQEFLSGEDPNKFDFLLPSDKLQITPKNFSNLNYNYSQNNKNQTKLLPTQNFSELRVIGQVLTTYLLLESESGLVIIDQHAAHERVVFEKLRKNKNSLQVRDLLVPIQVKLETHEIELFFEYHKNITKLGFACESFGENIIIIRSVPEFIQDKNLAKLIKDIISELSTHKRSDSFMQIFDHVCATIACHGSIRAGQRLGESEIKYLLHELDKIDFGAHCPHGRPVVKSFNQEDLKSWFHRT